MEAKITVSDVTRTMRKSSCSLLQATFFCLDHAIGSSKRSTNEVKRWRKAWFIVCSCGCHRCYIRLDRTSSTLTESKCRWRFLPFEASAAEKSEKDLRGFAWKLQRFELGENSKHCLQLSPIVVFALISRAWHHLSWFRKWRHAFHLSFSLSWIAFDCRREFPHDLGNWLSAIFMAFGHRCLALFLGGSSPHPLPLHHHPTRIHLLCVCHSKSDRCGCDVTVFLRIRPTYFAPAWDRHNGTGSGTGSGSGRRQRTLSRADPGEGAKSHIQALGFRKRNMKSENV